MKQEKEKRVPFSARIKSSVMDFLQTKAADNPDLTQAEIVENALERLITGHSDEEYQAIIKSKEGELELARKHLEELEKKTGKKIPKNKKIASNISQYTSDNLDKMAYAVHLSRAAYVREILDNHVSKTYPQLADQPDNNFKKLAVK